MIEAMACGTPVIAFRRGSVPEVVEDGVTGFIVDDEEAAVQAVGRLAELDRRGVRAAFERRFTSKRMAEEYVRYYEALVSQAATAQGLMDGTRLFNNGLPVDTSFQRDSKLPSRILQSGSASSRFAQRKSSRRARARADGLLKRESTNDHQSD
jgi:hypothetical protein